FLRDALSAFGAVSLTGAFIARGSPDTYFIRFFRVCQEVQPRGTARTDIFSDFHKIALDTDPKYRYNKSRMLRTDIRSIF
ncbi:MAG: hypothetical protein J5753_06425, partial [Oscillospiraceae bacterium]|nr:hypothetical protein [Oscillospiraceae bacterium]